MHRPPDMTRWQGRIDADEGDAGRRWHQIVRPLAAVGTAEGGVALLGFSCDAGVARNQGRTGARHGPAALRAMLANMPVARCRQIADAGDVLCEGDALESAQLSYASLVKDLLERGRLPLGLGGGHEIAFGAFCGLARYLGPRESQPAIGVINLDAHFDLRAGARATSGTPFRQIAEQCRAQGWPFRYCCLGVSRFANTEALFQRAQALDVLWRPDEAMDICRLADTLALLQRFMSGVDHLYLTVCLDVLPAAVAPGVSAPAARGVPLEVIEPIIDTVCASGKLRLADIAELNPEYDPDQRTARVAARLLARIAEQENGHHDGI